MDENLCRACLAPEGKMKYSSIFTDNGKIAKEIFKLTNLVILDLTDVDCPALICQRCLMDLERAVSFRELVIRSDDHFKESCSSITSLILSQLYNDVKIESKLRSELQMRSQKRSSLESQDAKTLLGDKNETKSLKVNENCNKTRTKHQNSEEIPNNLKSIVKEEQFEVEYAKNESQSENSSETSNLMDIHDNSTRQEREIDKNHQNTAKNRPNVQKVRQKITKMRPNPANFHENPDNFQDSSANFYEKSSTFHKNSSNFLKNTQNIRKKSPNFHEKSTNFDNIVQISGNLEQDSQISEQNFENFDQNSAICEENSNNFPENPEEIYQNFPTFYQNLDDFPIEDITPDLTPYEPHSLKQEQIQRNHIEISLQDSPKPKRRRVDPQIPQSSYSTYDNDTNELQCNVCNKIFSKKCYLTQHFQTIHLYFKPYKCKKCGKKYSELEELSLHEEKHVADKPFKCQCCSKSFIHKSDLKRHEISHSLEKPFQCTMCSRGFVRNDHLTKHLLVHQRKIGKGMKQKGRNVSDDE